MKRRETTNKLLRKEEGGGGDDDGAAVEREERCDRNGSYWYRALSFVDLIITDVAKS